MAPSKSSSSGVISSETAVGYEAYTERYALHLYWPLRVTGQDYERDRRW